MRWLGLVFGLSLFAVGCGNPCQEAFEKVKGCWSTVDCSKYPQVQQSQCSALRAAFVSSSNPSSCNGDPQQILDCSLDNTKLCTCR
jgi:hypothetical protein